MATKITIWIVEMTNSFLQCGVLRNIMSPNRLQDQSFEDLKRELKGHFAPKPLVIGERFNFHKWNQTPTESFSDYVAELQRLASTCEFGTYLQDALRD